MYKRQGFEWVDTLDHEHSILIYKRKGRHPRQSVLVALNFTPAPHTDYRIGVSMQGTYEELFNSDAAEFGGSGHFKNDTQTTDAMAYHGRAYSLRVQLPPLGGVVLKGI